MNSESKINVHYSSLVGLKAELLRKQAEVESAKAKLEKSRTFNKRKMKNNKEKVEEKCKAKDETEDSESLKTLKKSKLMLQAKSRLYDKLSKTHTNMSPHFLVDFEHKPDDVHNSDKELEDNANDYKSDSDSDSDWAEYTDCFGRTRKCLKEDLPKMQKEDKLLKEKYVEKSNPEVSKEKLFVEDRIPEKEPEIEIMRRKWEEQTAKLADKVDIHYQDILFDEARTHGVGYYSFSQDDEERAKQQQNLLKLRKETEEKQKQNQQIRDTKEKILQNRLKIARIRQKIRAGLSTEEAEKELMAENQEEKEESVTNKEENIEDENCTNSQTKPNEQEITKLKLQETENKIDLFGKMLGKTNQWYVMSQEEWVYKKRNERDTEFAPVYNNFVQGETFNVNQSANDQNVSLSTNDDSDVIGPMPPTQHAEMDEVIGPMPPTQHAEMDEVIGPMPPTQHAEMDEVIGPTPPTNGFTDTNINIEDQIEAGLKFLRRQFESRNK